MKRVIGRAMVFGTFLVSAGVSTSCNQTPADSGLQGASVSLVECSCTNSDGNPCQLETESFGASQRDSESFDGRVRNIRATAARALQGSFSLVEVLDEKLDPNTELRLRGTLACIGLSSTMIPIYQCSCPTSSGRLCSESERSRQHTLIAESPASERAGPPHQIFEESYVLLTLDEIPGLSCKQINGSGRWETRPFAGGLYEGGPDRGSSTPAAGCEHWETKDVVDFSSGWKVDYDLAKNLATKRWEVRVSAIKKVADPSKETVADWGKHAVIESYEGDGAVMRAKFYTYLKDNARVLVHRPDGANVKPIQVDLVCGSR